MNPLEEQRLVAEYATRRAAAEAEVVRWLEADPRSTLHRPEPLLAERERGGAIIFAPRAAGAETYWRYGIDARGRVVVAIRCQPHGSEEEQFTRFESTSVELVRYLRPDAPEEIGQGRLGDGSLLAWEASSSNWRLSEAYSWNENGLLRSIRSTHEQTIGPETVRFQTLVSPEYGPGGDLRALTEEQTGAPPRRVLLPPSPDRDRRALENALDRLERRLVTRLRAFVRERGEGSFCLALLYEPDMPLPVTPVLGPAQHALRAQGEASRLWNPLEWPGFDRLAQEGAGVIEADDEIRELTTAVEGLDVLDAGERAERVVTMLNRAAARLTRDLAETDANPLPRFIAYATDVTGADLTANLSVVIAAEVPSMLADERVHL